MNLLFRIICLITLFILTFNTAQGQNASDLVRLSVGGLGSDARSLGMGNAFTGVADNFEAIVVNPAGLAQIKKGNMTIGVKNFTYVDSSVFLGNNSNKSQNRFNFGQFGIVSPYPVYRGSLVFAFGYTSDKSINKAYKFDGFNRNKSKIRYLTDFNDDVPYYLRLSHGIYDDDKNHLYDDTPIYGNLNQSGELSDEGHLYSWSGAVAWEAAKNLYLGGSISYAGGWYTSDRQYYEDDFENYYGQHILTDPDDPRTADFQTFYANDILDWDLSGWTARIGFLYDSGGLFRFGGNVKFPTWYRVHEQYYQKGESSFGDGTLYYIDPPLLNDFKYDVRTPYEFSAGLSVNLLWLMVSGSVKYIDYTSAKFTGGFDSQTQLEKNLAVNDNLRGAVNANLGAEFHIPFAKTTARAGLIYNQSPYNGDDWEYDKKYITLGLGIGVDTAFQIDFAYAYGFWRDFSENYGNNISRVEHYVDSHHILLTTTFQF